LNAQARATVDFVPAVSAVVLAGGRSTRLKQDKALLKLDGEWVLESILHKLALLSDDLLVVGGDREELRPLGVPIVPDGRPGAGPLGGIHSGLQNIRYERGLFVACDMPLLSLPLLRYMIQLSPGFDVVIPRIGDYVEPLHAIYSKSCLLPIEDRLDCGERRVACFHPAVRMRYVEEPEINALDPEQLSFFNINNLQDLETGRQILQKRRRCMGPGRSSL
jgi:molybdopterin-guanine dinucleotide biosynthesis protein A